MATVPKKVLTRIKTEMKRYQKVLESAHSRDVNESDTVIIVSDILSDVLGYDKYSEITTEFAIRSTFCDLAVKIGDKIQFLIEVKAVGLDLKENHLRQAVNYAANQGINWIVLTNAVDWRVYQVLFQKPIKEELVFNLNLLQASARDAHVAEALYVLSREGIGKSAIEDYCRKVQATNRFSVAALLQSDEVLNVVRREIRKYHKGVPVDIDGIRELLRNDVLKRDVVEGEKPKEAMSSLRMKHAWAERKKTGAKKDATVASAESAPDARENLIPRKPAE